MIIQSTQNPKIKHVIHLQNKKFRAQHSEFIAQGFKVCETLKEAGLKLKSIFFTQEMYLEHQQNFLIEETYIVTPEIMRLISTTTNPAGIVAIFEMPIHQATASANSIVLHGIQDPGNLGTLIRSASAMNIDTIYLIDSVDLYNPKVIQATTGSFGTIKTITISWQDLLTTIGSIATCALVVNKGKEPNQIPLHEAILIIGNEGNGLPENVIKASTYQMTIPMPGKTESLNAAIAGSIGMYLKTLTK